MCWCAVKKLLTHTEAIHMNEFLSLHILLHTHTRLAALFPGLPRWAGTRKVQQFRILLKQETVSGSGISWAICQSASRSRQITTPAHHHSVFYRPDALPAAQPTASKHWRHILSVQLKRITAITLFNKQHQCYRYINNTTIIEKYILESWDSTVYDLGENNGKVIIISTHIGIVQN